MHKTPAASSVVLGERVRGCRRKRNAVKEDVLVVVVVCGAESQGVEGGGESEGDRERERDGGGEGDHRGFGSVKKPIVAFETVKEAIK